MDPPDDPPDDPPEVEEPDVEDPLVEELDVEAEVLLDPLELDADPAVLPAPARESVR